jgi:hypothetical protein
LHAHAPDRDTVLAQAPGSVAWRARPDRPRARLTWQLRLAEPGTRGRPRSCFESGWFPGVAVRSRGHGSRP